MKNEINPAETKQKGGNCGISVATEFWFDATKFQVDQRTMSQLEAICRNKIQAEL